MHSKIDELAERSESAYKTALDAVDAHRVDQGLEEIGDLAQLDEAKLFAELDEALRVDIAELPPPTTAPSEIAAPQPAPSPASSTRVTIRIPGAVLLALKAKALEKRIPYQTLANRVLRSAAAGWWHKGPAL